MVIRFLVMILSWTVLRPNPLGQHDRAAASPDVQALPRVRIVGMAYDSLTHAPLRGALISFRGLSQASPGSYQTRSDSAGHYSIDVPTGIYDVSLSHVALDSLGLREERRETVGEGAQQRIDLAVPSAATLRR